MTNVEELEATIVLLSFASRIRNALLLVADPLLIEVIKNSTPDSIAKILPKTLAVIFQSNRLAFTSLSPRAE